MHSVTLVIRLCYMCCVSAKFPIGTFYTWKTPMQIKLHTTSDSSAENLLWTVQHFIRMCIFHGRKHTFCFSFFFLHFILRFLFSVFPTEKIRNRSINEKDYGFVMFCGLESKKTMFLRSIRIFFSFRMYVCQHYNSHDNQ